MTTHISIDPAGPGGDRGAVTLYTVGADGSRTITYCGDAYGVELIHTPPPRHFRRQAAIGRETLTVDGSRWTVDLATPATIRDSLGDMLRRLTQDDPYQWPVSTTSPLADRWGQMRDYQVGKDGTLFYPRAGTLSETLPGSHPRAGWVQHLYR